MRIEWVTLVATQLTALAGALWAVWKWMGERREDRRIEQNRLAALYVNPFLFACEELQSRLYNILCLSGLGPLRKRNGYPYPEETLYFVAQYFAYEALVLRYTPYGTDPDVLTRIQEIRGEFSSAASDDDVDPWCIFRPRQRALGRLVLVSQESEQGAITETISLLDFEAALKKSAKALYLEDAILILRRAETDADLPERTWRRLAAVQGHLVDLLRLLEQEVGKLTGATSFSLHRGIGESTGRLKASQCGPP
jgi:hypothetical protein